jgi:hypothetical protein
MQSMNARPVAGGSHHFLWPAIISSSLVLPFLILEFVNARTFPRFAQSFPIPLFALLWLLAFSFVYILSRMIRRDSTLVRRLPALAGLGVVVLALIAFAWVGIVVDQMPCFLGVSNCD